MCLVKVIANLRKVSMAKPGWKLVAEYHDDPCVLRKRFSRNLLTYLLDWRPLPFFAFGKGLVSYLSKSCSVREILHAENNSFIECGHGNVCHPRIT